MFVQSSVRGYHAYFKYLTVRVGDLMMCEIEEDNPHDKYAVAVKNESCQTVGHIYTYRDFEDYEQVYS